MTRPPKATKSASSAGRPRRRRGTLATAAALVLLAMSSTAKAQESIAEQLFLEGKQLMAEENFELACAKFKAAHNLDRTATGTLLNLALCHERTKRTASAWAEFRQVAAESEGWREDRVKLAREHESRLAPLLSRVRIIVPPAAHVPGLTLVLDNGQPIADASWGTDLPVDPGPHVIHVAAPTRVAAEIPVTIGDVADRKLVTIPVLAHAPIEPLRLDADHVALERATAKRQTRRIVGYSLGGAGVATLAVGLMFGLSASSRNDDAKSLCNTNGVCPDSATKSEASHTLASAQDAASVANILSIAGGALVLGGAVLVLTALPGRATAPIAVHVTPLWGGAGLSLGGAL